MNARRTILWVLGAGVLAGGAFVSVGAPRLTLLNASVRIEYPWVRVAGSAAAGVGAAVLAAAASRTRSRLAWGALAALGVVSSLERSSFRLEADDRGLVSRGWLSETSVPWAEVSRVETGPDVVVIWGKAKARIRVDTADFDPEQRAALDRTIARRIREGGNPPR